LWRIIWKLSGSACSIESDELRGFERSVSFGLRCAAVDGVAAVTWDAGGRNFGRQDTIEFSSNIGQVNETFHTSIHQYSMKDANSGEAQTRKICDQPSGKN
jgi:hypothetical protein